MPDGVQSRLTHHFVKMGRPGKQALMMVADVVLLIFAVWAAYVLRFSFKEWFVPDVRQFMLMGAAPFLAIPVFIKAGLYRSVIRYVGEHALWAILKAMTLAALLWTALIFITQPYASTAVPRSVPLIYWLLGAVLVGGVRFFARWLIWLPVRRRFSGRQVLIYGAGDAGRQLAASLSQGRDLFPVGFIDDDVSLHGSDVQGLRVYSPEKLPWLIERFEIHDVIVTLPSASGARRREVVSFLEQYSLRVRILPSLIDIANGRHLVNLVREVDVGDLLGRDPVAADPVLLGRCISGKNVLVTGAGGSIGSELCRQISLLSPARIVLLEANEYALYQIDQSLLRMANCQIIPCLGSVEDGQLVGRLLAEHQVHTVYHAAAHKHVPLVEANVVEGVRNNVFGTQVLAQAALGGGVETFVLISTDKAVRPTNVMGATKRWAELIVQECAARARESGSGQCFCAVRFGNVLGSSGSVIPLFKKQIAQGGPVTVTHPEVTRYFMSIHEAVQLVIQAGSLAEGGDVFLLDMGEPVKIMDLACNMIRLAGYTPREEDNPAGDIEIIVTGLRPGEKLYEELLIASGNAEGTAHPKIMKADEPGLEQWELHSRLRQLKAAVDIGDIVTIRTLLMKTAIGDTLTRSGGDPIMPPLGLAESPFLAKG